MVAMRTKVMMLGALLLVGACKTDDDPGGDGTDSGSGIPTSGSSTTASTSTTASGGMTENTTEDPTATSETSPMTTDSTTDSSTGSLENDGTANDPDNPLDCGGTIYECGDGKDNDGDGHTDLFDPECTGPCDDDESSFQTGIPGDNVDCKQDFFFDGNSGQGDDRCIWDLRCDPENPGEHINCEYTGGNNCGNMPPNQSQDCIEFCSQYVPPGCDCFGCCVIQTDEGEVSIFLNSHPDCSFDNLDACSPCTQSEDCVNDCVPEECEVCFGETEPPEGCDEGSCETGDPCTDNSDCPTDYACYLGCCYPPPPG
jgi:hypothetical protein